MENKTVNRIKEYLDAKSVSLNAFDKAIGVGNGYFGKQLKRQASVGSDILEKIFCTYPDLNPIWLLTGEGNMIYTSKDISDIYSYTPNSTNRHNVLSEQNNTYNDPPTKTKNNPPTDAPKPNIVHASVHPNQSLGLPKVITVGENDDELISLVPHKSAAGYLNGYADPEYVESLPTIRMPNIGGGTHRAFETKGHSMNPTLYNGSISIGRWVENFDDIKDRRIYIVVTKSEGIVTKRVLNRIQDAGKLILVSDNQNKREYPNILLDADDVLELWYQRANLSFEFPEPDLIYNRVNDLEARMALFEENIRHLLK